jgi:hypothetical protein
MGYKKHFAYYSKGGWKESYLCVCPRTQDHPVSRTAPEVEVPLFDLSPDGEMRAG